MIYQELNLAPQLTVEENIMLGKERTSGLFLKKKEMRQTVRDVLRLVNHPEIPLDTPIQNLSVGIKQIVEIARALADNARVLIMDEPTSSLSLEDSERLFQIIRSLKEQGVSIIYISHFLEEVQKVADRYTVLRDGNKIAAGHIRDVSLEKIIHHMVGQKLTEMFPKIPHEMDEAILSLDGFQGKKMPVGIDLNLHRGEILGFAGLVGAGRTDVLRAVFGLDAVVKGKVRVVHVQPLKSSPWARIKQGLGYLSEDRQKEGLALSLSIADNIALSHFAPYTSLGFLNLKKYKKGVLHFLQSMRIKTAGSDLPALSLSGGNQQKVALARLLHQKADILLLDEPTRGIDVLSKTQIYGWMGELASRGKAVIFVSSYLPELLGVCDNIAVFHRGRLVETRRADAWDAHGIMTAATLGRTAERESIEKNSHA
jgi:ribose transport system ATP-binding protein